MMGATPNPVVEVIVVEDAVWCESIGATHEANEDPYHYGPQYGSPDKLEDSEWVWRTGHDDWPGTLMFYVCPGPHSYLYTTLEPIAELPKRGETSDLGVMRTNQEQPS